MYIYVYICIYIYVCMYVSYVYMYIYRIYTSSSLIYIHLDRAVFCVVHVCSKAANSPSMYHKSPNSRKWADVSENYTFHWARHSFSQAPRFGPQVGQKRPDQLHVVSLSFAGVSICTFVLVKQVNSEPEVIGSIWFPPIFGRFFEAIPNLPCKKNAHLSLFLYLSSLYHSLSLFLYLSSLYHSLSLSLSLSRFLFLSISLSVCLSLSLSLLPSCLPASWRVWIRKEKGSQKKHTTLTKVALTLTQNWSEKNDSYIL